MPQTNGSSVRYPQNLLLLPEGGKKSTIFFVDSLLSGPVSTLYYLDYKFPVSPYQQQHIIETVYYDECS